MGPNAIVDGRVIDHPTAGGRGVGRYTVGFVRAMLAAGIETQVLCATDRQIHEWRLAIPEVRADRLSRAHIRRAADRQSWFVCTQLMLHPVPLDVIPRAVTECRMSVAAIIHDVIPQRYPDRYLSDPFARAQTTLRTMTCASIDRFCANSTFTADTASIELALPRSRFVVVGAVVEPQFVEADGSELRPSVDVGGGQPYVLAVTGADPRKNTERLLRAWAALPVNLRTSHKLVIACAAPDSTIAHWNHLAHVDGIDSQVTFTGGIDDERLVQLMQHAALGVMPSLEEGFGLPIAEMVACGTPVVCSRTSSMPEVAGCEDALFDPFDVGDIAAAIATALADSAVAHRILEAERERLGDWRPAVVGAKIRDALHVTPRATHTDVPSPRTIAIASPPPESPSGIGEYTELVRHAWMGDDELITLDDCASSSLRPRRAVNRPVRGVGSLGSRLRSHDFDHLIIALGSSQYHAVSAERARDQWAHLWIHEPTLLGALIGPGHYGGGARWAAERLSGWGEHVAEADALDPVLLHERGYTGLKTLLGDARSVIVSSAIARDIVIHECDNHQAPPTFVLPLAHPKRERVHLPDGMRIVTLGWVEPSKEIERCLRLVASIEGAHLDVVGGVADEYAAQIAQCVQQLGIEGRVDLHSRVSDAQLNEVLARATCGVQFRTGHPGQMSASVCELLARGIPVVTNMVTHGDGDAGLRVVADYDDTELLESIMRMSNRDDWSEASEAAWLRAQSWQASDVAEALRGWLISCEAREDELSVHT